MNKGRDLLLARHSIVLARMQTWFHCHSTGAAPLQFWPPLTQHIPSAQRDHAPSDLSQAATVPEPQHKSLGSRSGVLSAGATPPLVPTTPCEHRGERAPHPMAPYSLNSMCVNASAGQTRGLWCTKPWAGRKLILLAMCLDSIKLHDTPLVF